jgi:hypothetical protein
MKRVVLVVTLFLASSLLPGCAIVPFIPIVGSAHQGYVGWKGQEATKYYFCDLKTTYQIVKRTTRQLELETKMQPLPKEKGKGYAMETKGNNPMEINVVPAGKRVTKVIIRVAFFGDKQFAELFYKTLDDNMPRRARIQ